MVILIKKTLLSFFQNHPTKIKFNSHYTKESYEFRLNDMKSKMHIFLSSYPNIYDYIQKNLGEDFDVYSFTEFIHQEKRICQKCGKERNFLSLSSGFEKCGCYKDDIKTKKKQLWDYLNQESIRHGIVQYKLFGLKDDEYFLKNFLELKNIETKEELYLFLKDEEPQRCPCCGKLTQFKTFFGRKSEIDKPYAHYKQFCSTECRNRWWAEQQKGDNNTIQRTTPEILERMKQHNSKLIKKYIADGQFTPNVTNSWARSKIIVKFKRNDEIITRPVRYSWEAFFQLMNPNCEYEQLRVQYYNEKKQQYCNYIVDFIDYKNKIVYEVKPKNCIEKRANPEKFSALNAWIKENGFEFHIISEDYFQTHQFRTSLLEFMDSSEREKILLKLKRYYKNFWILDDLEIDENQKH